VVAKTEAHECKQLAQSRRYAAAPGRGSNSLPLDRAAGRSTRRRAINIYSDALGLKRWGANERHLSPPPNNLLPRNYVYVYVIYIKRDRRISNNNHKNQSQNDIQYKAAKPKTVSLYKVI